MVITYLFTCFVQSHYDLINITGISVQSSNEDGSKDIELQFICELPTNWTEVFDEIPVK